MEKKLAGLLGAVGALVAAGPGQAAPVQPSPQTVMQANSYADLLRPIANAAEVLRAVDATAQPEAQVMNVQYYRDHHHHHHNNYYRRPVRHHHHHHHHHRNDRPVLGVVIR